MWGARATRRPCRRDPPPLCARHSAQIGHTFAYIVVIYVGVAVLDAATAHPLGAEPERDNLDGLPAAICRTAALADTSIREALLSSIVLVGGGSMQPNFSERLERELVAALSRTPWRPRVKANADRRVSSWLGGTVFCSMPSAEELFVSRAEYERDPSSVHRKASSLPCLPLEALEAQQRAKAEAAAAEEAAERQRTAHRLRAASEEARTWWVAQAPAGGREERTRQRQSQQRHVLALFEQALVQTGLHWRAEHSLRPSPPAERQASAAEIVDADGAERPSPAGVPSMPAAAALALAGSSMRLLSGAPACNRGGDEGVWRRVSHLLAAEWASSDMNTRGDNGALDAHHEARARARAVRCFRAWAHSRHDAFGRARRAVSAWTAPAQSAAMRAWKLWLRNRQVHAQQMAEASRWRLTAQLGDGWATWQSRAKELSAASRLLRKTATRFAGWRGFGAWLRWLLGVRRVKVLGSIGHCRLMWNDLGRRFRVWVLMARMTARQRNALFAQAFVRNRAALLSSLDKWVELASRRRSEVVGALRKARLSGFGTWVEWAHSRAREARLRAVADSGAKAMRVTRAWRRLLFERQWHSTGELLAGVVLGHQHELRVRRRSSVLEAWREFRARRAAKGVGERRRLGSAIAAWMANARQLREGRAVASKLSVHAPKMLRARQEAMLTRGLERLWLVRTIGVRNHKLRQRALEMQSRVVPARLRKQTLRATAVWAKETRSCARLAESYLRALRRLEPHALVPRPPPSASASLSLFSLTFSISRLRACWHARRSATAFARWSVEARYRKRLSAKWANAAKLYPQLGAHWPRRQRAAALAHWSSEAQRRAARQEYLRQQLWYMDELRDMLDNANESHPAASVRRLLKSGVEAGAIELLDTKLCIPRALRIMRAGVRHRSAALEHELKRICPSSRLHQGWRLANRGTVHQLYERAAERKEPLPQDA